MSAKLILITGVSSGIGYATCEQLLRDGQVVIGTVRTQAETSTHALRDEFKDRLQLYAVDLSEPAQIAKFISDLPALIQKQGFQKIDVSIQNAGLAVAAPFVDQPFSEVELILRVNLLSVLQLTQKIIPLMRSPGGRHVMISSVSGQNGTPFLAAYCASKHAIEGFSESLRRELHFIGQSVHVVGPGSVKTPIWKKGFEKIQNFYDQTQYSKPFKKFLDFATNEEQNGLDVQSVVDEILHAATSDSPCLRYAPIPRKFRNYYLAKLFSKKMMDRITIKALGL